jgi:hypothetical protein
VTNEERQLVDGVLRRTKAGDIRWRRLGEPPPLPQHGEWVYTASLPLADLGLVVLRLRVPSRLDLRDSGTLDITADDGRESSIALEDDDRDRLRAAVEAGADADLTADVLRAMRGT